MTHITQVGRVFKTYKFRLYPTEEQEARLNSWFAASRHIYNAALEQRKTYGRPKGTDAFGRPSIFKGCGKASGDVVIQDSEVGWKKLADDPDLAWLTDLPSVCRQIALQDLDKAFDGFFKGRGGYPSFRSAATFNSVRFQCWSGDRANVVFGKDSVKFPRIGRIAYNRHVKPRGRFGQASIIREGGRFYVCLTCDHGEREIVPDMANAIGIDLGVKLPVALSDGTAMPPDAGLKELDAKARDLQRKSSRKKKGSRRRRKAMAKIARVKRHMAARRKGRSHEVTTEIVRQHSVIAVEDLRVRNMTKSAKGTIEEPGSQVRQKSGLNRAILNVAPYQIRQMLDYKAAKRGGMVIAVPAKNTSRTCHECGSVSKEHRKGQALFECGDCGHTDNADVNAARNILSRALPGHAKVPCKTPSEPHWRSATLKPIESPHGPGTAHASENRGMRCGISGGHQVVE